MAKADNESAKANLVYWGKGLAKPTPRTTDEFTIKSAFYRRLHMLALSQEQDVRQVFEQACREVF